MKRYLMPSIKITVVLLVLLCVLYPLFIAAIARLAPGKGGGITLGLNGKVTGYENVGQLFDQDRYFWSRPSAVNYNAAGSGGSNKGPSNKAYLQTVEGRINNFLEHHPYLKRSDIPAEMVTASGSGLDPHISPEGAFIQVHRVARVRSLSEDRLRELVREHTDGPLMGLFGPPVVNVLKLNVALDQISPGPQSR